MTDHKLYTGMMMVTSQQFGKTNPETGTLEPVFNADGTPFENFVLYSFDRGFYDGAGNLQREDIHCRLSFFSMVEIRDFVREQRAGIPIPSPGTTKKTKETKWSPDVTFNWKHFK